MRIEIQRLLLTRQLLDAADSAFARADDVSLLKGVLLGDLAAETLLKATLDQLGQKVDEKSNFSKLIDMVVEGGKAIQKDFSCAQRLRSLREIRNPAQHAGVIPRRDEALRRFSEAKMALRNLCAAAFDMELNRLRAVDFVKNPLVARLLRDAEIAFGNGEYEMGFGGCVAAFDCVIREWTGFNQRLFGLREPPRDLFGQIVASLSSGIYLPDLARFRKATEGVSGFVAADGVTLHVQTGNGWDSRTNKQDHDAAEYALDFVSGFALQIETALADGLAAP